jgi:hypothetical protein
MENTTLDECMNYVPPLMCFSCEHFAVDRSRHYPSWRRGECRRLSPQPLAVGPDREVKSVWPTVSELDWCGDGVRKKKDD